MSDRIENIAAEVESAHQRVESEIVAGLVESAAQPPVTIPVKGDPPTALDAAISQAWQDVNAGVMAQEEAAILGTVIDDPLAAVASEAAQALKVESTDERETPQWLFDALDEEFDFVWDLAANQANRKTTHYFGPDHPLLSYRDGLKAEWANVIRAVYPDHRGPRAAWLNCPYSRGSILRWCEKCEHESAQGLTIVSLLPADTSTEYWHRYIRTGEKRTLKQRLKFGGAPLDSKGKLQVAKFGSVLRIWRPTHRYWSFD